VYVVVLPGVTDTVPPEAGATEPTPLLIDAAVAEFVQLKVSADALPPTTDEGFAVRVAIGGLDGPPTL
jgi:hypothetical protein